MSSWKKQKARLRRKRKGLPFPTRVDERRVAILTPACDTCHTGYAMSLVHMLSVTYRAMLAGEIEPFAMTVNSYGTSILPFSRQILAKTALDQKATHMLWIDSDMEFPSDMLMRFMRHDAPIVGINAMSRRKPYRNTAQTMPGEPLTTTLDSTGLEKVFHTGFGVIWIASEVFEKMEAPYFAFEWMPELSVFKGEDYVFFEKAKALGYECYVDHDISKAVYHSGAFGFNPLLIAQAEASGRMADLTQAEDSGTVAA
jgi:hypothetical protein